METEIQMTPQKVNFFRRAWVQSLVSVIVVFGSLGGFVYWQMTKDVVKVDTSHLDAPLTSISPSSAGMLNALYVTEGQSVAASSPIALVGSETIYTKEAGIIASAPKVIGSYYAPGQTVVTVIANQKMRVVGTVDETEGLSRLSPGERAVFTVDAFPGKNYEGVVDEVSPTSNTAGIAFTISDKRPVKQFSVYIRFDTTKYPELKSGMSARSWITVS